MTTFKVMQDRVADEIKRGNLTSQIKNAIVSAIEDLKGERFARINESTVTVNTVADQQWYTLASDFRDENGAALASGTVLIEVDQAVCNFNNWFQPLRPVSAGWIDTYQIPTYTGQPYYYGFLSERVRFAPTPNGVYTVTIRGQIEYPALSADSDTNAWMTRGEKLIRSRAKTILARDVLQDMELAQMASMAEAEARIALERQTAARSTQRLSAWGY